MPRVVPESPHTIPRPAKLVRVIDGDTVDLRVDLGFRLDPLIRFRLLDVDTPEVYGVRKTSAEYAEGLRASQFTANWFDRHALGGVWVVAHKHGKYGRWLAEIFTATSCLNDELAAQGWRASE